MDFIIQIYNTKQLFVKESKRALFPVKKEKITSETRKINGFGTYVHLMDKTDILRDNTERIRFSAGFMAGKAVSILNCFSLHALI